MTRSPSGRPAWRGAMRVLGEIFAEYVADTRQQQYQP